MLCFQSVSLNKKTKNFTTGVEIALQPTLFP